MSVRTCPGGTRSASSGGTLRRCQGKTMRAASASPAAEVKTNRDPRLHPTWPEVRHRSPRSPQVAEAIGATRSKNAKRDLLAEYLRGLPAADLGAATAFFAGRPLLEPTAKLGMGWVQQGAALGAASQADPEALREAYLRHSDFGDAAAEVLAGRPGHRPDDPRGRRCVRLDRGRLVGRSARGADDVAVRAGGERRGALHRPDRLARDAHRAPRGTARGGRRGRLRGGARRRAARPHADRRDRRGRGPRPRGPTRRCRPARRPTDPVHARHAGRRRGRGRCVASATRRGSRTSTTASGRSSTSTPPAGRCSSAATSTTSPARSRRSPASPKRMADAGAARHRW